MTEANASTAPKPERRPARRPIYWTAPVVALLLAVVWSAAARFLLLQAEAEDEVGELNAVAALHRVEQETIAARLAAECELLTNEPALRSLLRTPGVDRATLDDYLSGVTKHLRLKLAAILTTEGRVVAVVGDDTLGDAQLVESSLLRRALAGESAATGIWGSQRQLLQVAAMPIRFGEVNEAVLILGSPLDRAPLERAWSASKAGAALAIGDVVVASWPAELGPALETARTLPAGKTSRFMHGGSLHLARTDALDGAVLPASITFVRPLGVDRFATSLRLLWLPPLLVLAWSALRIGRRWRQT